MFKLNFQSSFRQQLLIIITKPSMKALILVGGFGTRLRPLTMHCPKSVFPFINIPMVQHQIRALAQIGVQQVVLAINYQAEQIQKTLQPLQQEYKIKITYSKEPQPFGTAGPIKLAEEILKKGNPEELIFVFNSDIICDYPLKKLLQTHKKSNGLGTIVLAQVVDPSRFGVVVTNPQQNNRVQSFVQKPKQYISNCINAGIYLLSTKIIERIPKNKKCMIQRQIFPQMATNKQLYSLKIQNKFWFDVGKPEDYLNGQQGYLTYFKLARFGTIKQEIEHPPQQKPQIVGNVLIDPSSKIDPTCKIGPNVVIGPNCVIGKGTRIKNASIIKNIKIGDYCYIDKSIISWDCQIGNWVRMEGLSILGEGVKLANQLRVTQTMILSNININRNAHGQILMY